MVVIIIIGLTIILSYVGLILYILNMWSSQETYQVQQAFQMKSLNFTYAVVISARNEEKNILNCLSSIRNNRLFSESGIHVYIVDDFSTDKTSDLVSAIEDPQIHLYKMSDHVENPGVSGKKVALQTIIDLLDVDYIIQLDADTTVKSDYLTNIVSFIEQNNPDFVAMPVIIQSNTHHFQNFQSLDYAGMMAVTQAGIFSKSWYMANGANMSYKRDKIKFSADLGASGDDVYGIQEIAQNGGKIHFLKSLAASAYTPALSSVKMFYNQRIRWATKNKYMGSFRMQLMMGIPFVNALCLLVYPFIFFITPNPTIGLLWINHLLLYLAIDYLFLKNLSEYFSLHKEMKSFFTAKLYHLIYIIGIGLMSFFVRKFEWKGRLLE